MEFGSTWRQSTRDQLDAAGVRRLDVHALADAQHLGAHDPGAGGDVGQPDGEADVERAEAEDGDQRQRQQQAGDGQQHVDDAHQRVVEPAADEAGDEADGRPDDDTDGDGEQRGAQRQPGAVHGAREQVAAELVGAEQVRPRRRLQLGLRVRLQRVDRRQQRRQRTPRRR